MTTTTTYPDWEEKLFKKILNLEGGYQDLENDSGNYTKPNGTRLGTMRGITPRTYADYHNKNINNVTVAQMQAISKADAIKIYHDNYVEPFGFGQLPEDIRDSVIDMSIHHGPESTLHELQALAGMPKNAQTNVVNAATLKAVKDNVTPNSWAEERVRVYEDIIERKPKNKEFRSNWIDRAKKWLPKSLLEQMSSNFLNLQKRAVRKATRMAARKVSKDYTEEYEDTLSKLDPTQRTVLKHYKKKGLYDKYKKEGILDREVIAGAEWLSDKKDKEKKSATMKLQASARKPASVKEGPVRISYPEESDVDEQVAKAEAFKLSLEERTSESEVPTVESEVSRTLDEIQDSNESIASIKDKIKAPPSEPPQEINKEGKQIALEAKARRERWDVKSIRKLSRLGELGIRN